MHNVETQHSSAENSTFCTLPPGLPLNAAVLQTPARPRPSPSPAYRAPCRIAEFAIRVSARRPPPASLGLDVVGGGAAGKRLEPAGAPARERDAPLAERLAALARGEVGHEARGRAEAVGRGGDGEQVQHRPSLPVSGFGLGGGPGWDERGEQREEESTAQGRHGVGTYPG
jgi:hypothetical protein